MLGNQPSAVTLLHPVWLPRYKTGKRPQLQLSKHKMGDALRIEVQVYDWSWKYCLCCWRIVMSDINEVNGDMPILLIISAYQYGSRNGHDFIMTRWMTELIAMCVQKHPSWLIFTVHASKGDDVFVKHGFSNRKDACGKNKELLHYMWPHHTQIGNFLQRWVHFTAKITNQCSREQNNCDNGRT